MPLFKNKVLAGNEYTGNTAADGFFEAKAGPDTIQVDINSILFHTTVSCDFSISVLDPNDSGNEIILLAGSGTDLFWQPVRLPTEDKFNWPLKFITSGMTGIGWLTIDYDFVQTEG